jgi:hypothetical protein
MMGDRSPNPKGGEMPWTDRQTDQQAGEAGSARDAMVPPYSSVGRGGERVDVLMCPPEECPDRRNIIAVGRSALPINDALPVEVICRGRAPQPQRTGSS